MSVEVLNFTLDDLHYLDVQERHRHYVEKALELPDAARQCLEKSWSFTGWSEDGRALWCVGVYDKEVWGFLAKDLKRNMISMVRWGRKQLVAHLVADGPLLVDCRFPEAVRLAKALGCRHIGGIHWIFDEKCNVNSTPH